jgi:hypothetical protein
LKTKQSENKTNIERLDDKEYLNVKKLVSFCFIHVMLRKKTVINAVEHFIKLLGENIFSIFIYLFLKKYSQEI